MPELLVSVTDASEARAAVEGGARIIDVKDPAAGALGAPLPEIIRAVRETVPRGLTVSAAVGDGPLPPAVAALAAVGAAAAGAGVVKVALLEPDRTPPLPVLGAVCRALAEVAPGVQVVAVALADLWVASGFDPCDLPALAAQAGAAGCMLDTARKGQGSLLSVLPQESLARFVLACRERRLLAGLAGSLGQPELPAVAALAPDVIGVRGAACRGGRLGRIDAQRVAQLAATLAGAAAARRT